MFAEVDALERRAALHRALGDVRRLAMVDALELGDRTPGELRDLTGADWNLLEFHLRTLETAGLVERRVSEGDRRRRYVRLRQGARAHRAPSTVPPAARVLFVCTHNSARSQFAAGLWSRRTGRPALSAGTDPAPRVHPLAVTVARAYDVELDRARPAGFAAVPCDPDLVISVCDRAREGGVPFEAPQLHWSVSDPATRDRRAFERAFADIAERLEGLARAVAA